MGASFWEDRPGGRESTCSAWPRGWAMAELCDTFVDPKLVVVLISREEMGGEGIILSGLVHSFYFIGLC